MQVVKDREAAKKQAEEAGSQPRSAPKPEDIDIDEARDAREGGTHWVVRERPMQLQHGPEALRKTRGGWVRHVGDMYATSPSRYVLFNPQTYTPIVQGKEDYSFEYW